ncbi:MAG: hypothetical protein MN733_02640 [Nitrososphaera sp.]|nr:hypothetical protein [Nitrososphaera sp.]
MPLSKVGLIALGATALGLFIWLIVYLCSWETVYGPEQEASGVVVDKYNRAAHSTYHPGMGNQPARWVHHPAVWRITIRCSEPKCDFEVSGQSAYNAVVENQKVSLVIQPYWRVRMKDEKEVAREWGGYRLVSYR